MCLHTIIVSPTDPQRITVAISSAGSFRTDDGGTNWKPINKGLVSEGIPDGDAEVGDEAVGEGVDPAVHGDLLAAGPGVLDKDVGGDVADLTDHIQFAQPVMPVAIVVDWALDPRALEPVTG